MLIYSGKSGQMTSTTYSIYFGGFLELCFLSSLILNLSVLIVLKKSGFLNSAHCSVYIFAFANITGNTLMMLLYASYLAPSSILQSFIFQDDLNFFPIKLMGYFFHALWLQDMLIQLVTSINRVVVVLHPKQDRLFSRNRTILLAVFVFAAGFTLAYIANFVLPCCSMYLYYGSMSYTYLNDVTNETNLNNMLIALPINVSCSVIPAICYFSILIYVRKSNKKMLFINKSVYVSRKTQELRHAFQFSVCTGACIFIWVTYRIMSSVIGTENSPIFAILTFLHVFHCSANSLVFLILNKEVRNEFRKIIFGQKISSSTVPTMIKSTTKS